MGRHLGFTRQMMGKFAACLCVASVSAGNLAVAEPPLSPAEEYLTPYLSELLDPRKNIFALGLAGLAKFVNAGPTSIENWIIGRLVPDGEISIPVNTSVNVQIPAGAGKVEMDFLIHYATVGGLNGFKTLKPMNLLADGRFTWGGILDLSELPFTAKTELEQWGLAAAINGSVSKPSVNFQAIIAMNITKLKKANFRLLRAPLNCAIWAIAADENAGMLALNVTSATLDMEDVNADFNITGGTFGKEWNDQFAQNLKDALTDQKPNLLANLSTIYSEQLRVLANQALLDQIPTMQHENPCIAEGLESVIV